jgi:hypothetical protein
VRENTLSPNVTVFSAVSGTSRPSTWPNVKRASSVAPCIRVTT